MTGSVRPELRDWVAEVEAACADGRPDSLAIVGLLRGAPKHAHRRIAEVVRCTGAGYGTISVLSWVASRVPAEVERDGLLLGHYVAVAPLDPADQAPLLERALLEGWSATDLRSHVALGRDLEGGAVR